MFGVIYHWKLKEGVREEDFYKSWEEKTQEIKEKYGSHGSALHKLPDGTYLAYARWPDKNTWQKMMNDPERFSGNKPFIESVEPPKELEVVSDQVEL